MKNLFILILAVISFSSCDNREELKREIRELEQHKSSLYSDIQSLNIERNEKSSEINSLDEKLKEKKILASGKTPKYILKIHLKQSHFSLSIKKHIKDAMNAIDFELPVDKDFYNSVSEGTAIQDEFRWGSLLLSGSFGDWEMTVKGKEIRE